MSPVSFGPAGVDRHARSEEMRLLGHLLTLQVATSPAAAGLSCQGLIDTGASDICIDYRVAERLGLEPIDQTTVGVVGGVDVSATVYRGILRVPELRYEQFLPLYGLRLRRATHSVLIGRSFLQGFIVTFDGPEGTFHFENASARYSSPDFDE